MEAMAAINQGTNPLGNLLGYIVRQANQNDLAREKDKLNQFLATGDYTIILPERKGNPKYDKYARNRPVIVRVIQGRNDKCACGSGRKFKQCCMSKAA